ncbi:MAG: acyltransferase family protein [Rhizomicrobium sp.]
MTVIKRLTALDALRGVAALSVVAWHWQHFFAISGDWQPGWSRTMQPFYWLLKPLYVQGWAAVDLFFVLSGFVFFWLYSQSIREQRMAVGAFALMRFSRLYPLQVLMLVTAAVLQAVYFQRIGTFFIYKDNDWQHFLLHLGLVQNWWPNMPQSFDGPSWSVSIEVLLYVLFFTACRFGLRAGWPSLLVAIAGAPLMWFDEHICRGVIGFFMGGFVYALWERFRAHSSAVTVTRALGVSALAGWGVLVFLLYSDNPVLDGGEVNIRFLYVFDYLLCPLTVLALALYESTSGRRFARLAFLGDISYSTYMLHFPMQLALVLLALRIGLAPAFFMQGWVMVAFLVALIALGGLSYFYFEKPMQAWLRRGTAPRAAPAE